MADQAIIVFDAFVGNSSDKDYVIKCATIVNITKNVVQQFDFAPPFDWDLLTHRSRKQNMFLTKYIHGLTWYSGEIPHSRLSALLKEKTDNVDQLYAKGVENCRFLSDLLGREVLNMENTVMFHLPEGELKSVADRVQRVTTRCMADHGGLDQFVSISTVHTACCFTRALRFAEYLRVYVEYQKRN